MSRIDGSYYTPVDHWKWRNTWKIGDRQDGDIIVLRPMGRIDNDPSPAFQAKFLSSVASAGAAVLVYFSAVEYISSAAGER